MGGAPFAEQVRAPYTLLRRLVTPLQSRLVMPLAHQQPATWHACRPREVTRLLESPERVVVRPAELTMNVQDFLRLHAREPRRQEAAGNGGDTLPKDQAQAQEAGPRHRGTAEAAAAAQRPGSGDMAYSAGHTSAAERTGRTRASPGVGRNPRNFSLYLEYLAMKVTRSARPPRKPCQLSRDSACPRLSARSVCAQSNVPELLPDVAPLPKPLGFAAFLRHGTEPNLWIGSGHTLGKLHFDPYENLLCMLRGRKVIATPAPSSTQW